MEYTWDRYDPEYDGEEPEPEEEDLPEDLPDGPDCRCYWCHRP